MQADQLFKTMVERKASDLFLKVGSVPHLRVNGALQPLGSEPLSRAEILQFATDLMGPQREQLFQQQRELNFAFQVDQVGRFRANVMWQRGTIALVIRNVNTRIPTLEELHLPADILRRLARERRGLVLITGATGHGKSTTAAAVLEELNRATACHIVTLEDPIEYLFEEQRAVINQREVGVDTKSFSDGLKNVLRQNPDVLFISDLRDRETMEAALLAAESGQLVISCIHTTNALTTMERVVSFFPPHQHVSLRFRLSLALVGTLSLRLIARRDAAGVVPACEVMVMTPAIRQCVREGAITQIPALIREGQLHGMQTLTASLYQLVQSGWITPEEALRAADSPEELDLLLRDVRASRDVSDIKHE